MSIYGYQKIFVDGLEAMGYGIAFRPDWRALSAVRVSLQKLELACFADRLNRVSGLDPSAVGKPVLRQILALACAEPKAGAGFATGRAENV